MLVPQHAGDAGRADRAELDRLVGEALRHLPDRAGFERPARHFLGDDRRLIRLLHLPENMAGLEPVPAHPAARGRTMALDPVEPLDRIEEPRLAADIEVKPTVTVGNDVEP